MYSNDESGWPVIGRDGELARALAALDPDSTFHGVALVGDSGVGKSTLARALADSLAADGQTVRFVLGTQTGRDVPLGAFSRSVTIHTAHEPAAMLAAAHKTLATAARLVVVVDDAQLLDPLSATLVHQIAADGTARVIVTIRPGEPALDAVTALLKEGLLLTLHLDAFTPKQTGDLARRILGDTVKGRLIGQLHSRSGGNPLLLRGLLKASREDGVLDHTETGWQLQGALHPDRELLDRLEFRLESLDRDELDALEILATAELLDWEIFREICDPDAVSRLERRGWIQLVADGSGMVARLTNPVVGEAALQRAGLVRSRQLNGVLARACQKHLRAGGGRLRLPDVRGRIRAAQFMMLSDVEPDLELIIEAAASAAALSNLARAEELSRFALDRGGGPQAAFVLAEALCWQGRGEEAEALLADVHPDDSDETSTVRFGCLRAANLFWTCADVESAQRMLAEVADRADSEASTALVQALQVTFAFFSGDLATTIETGPALCAPEVTPLVVAWAAVPTALGLAEAGRFGDVRRIAEAGLRAAVLSESGPIRFALGVAEAMAFLAAGDFPQAHRVVERYAAMTGGVPGADAMVDVLSGLVQLAGGELLSACSALQDSLPVLSHGAPSPWPVLVAAWLAQAEGARGNAAAAAAALRSCEDAYGPQAAVFLPELELARAWERAAAGETSAGQNHAVCAAQVAHGAGMWAVEMWALHTATRFGDRSHADRLAELAATLNTPLADVIAGHARGLADHDGEVLSAAADRFAELGALALAADAAAQAAGEHLHGGRRGKGLESSARAQWLAGQGGIHTPAITAVTQPLPVTDREREIATLVAAGLSNRQIADRLSVSVRTVDGHLYRIYAKLGIERRDELATMFQVAGPPA